MMVTKPVQKAVVETPLGDWFLSASESGVSTLSFGVERGERGLLRWVERFEPEASVRAVEAKSPNLLPVMKAAIEQLQAYASGELRTFELALDLRGSSFQLSVWGALCDIPYGETRTYGEVARGLENPGAFRAVGGASGANPVAIIVPCHRVLASNSLGGFSGGMPNKRRLLAHEGHAVQSSFV